jgi:hypothetical protein
MPFDELHVVVSPVFLIASSSRYVVWLRSGVRTKKTDAKGNYVPPVEPEVHHDYRSDHLTPEAVEYVLGSPQRSDALCKRMQRTWETMKEMDFELFLLKQGTHSSLAEGVL